MFDNLTQRLGDALHRLSGRGRITESNIDDTVRQIRLALLEADVALPVAKDFIERVRQRALGAEVARSLNPGQAFTKIIHDELVAMLGDQRVDLAHRGLPVVVMLVGLQGAGKTTSAAKLARFLPQAFAGGDALLVSTDVYRPAAIDQLRQLAKSLGVAFLEPASSDPEQIARAALQEAKRRGTRWLIVDTAGRLHVDEAMMAEAARLHEVLAPTETLFVLDAMAGQDAVNSAGRFHAALPLTGVILTKADGDTRGGAVLSVRAVTGLPIKLVGVGEKTEALESFDPERMANRILGMGDVVGLVEQVQRQVDHAAAERMAAKVKSGREMTLVDLRDQFKQLISMGGLGGLLDKLPLPRGMALPAGALDERQLRRQIGIIDAMTPAERRRPDLIDGSRKRRIAAGAGLQVQEVSRLLKQHKHLAKTMKRVSKGGMSQLLGRASGLSKGRGPGGARFR
jgi:signal recognition particle subunit SRP54